MKYDLSNISLVVATFNEEESIGFVLEELKNYKFHEIIIVDNKSSDKTLEIIKKYNIKILVQEKPGWGNAVIEGFNKSSGKYICYIDGDGSYNPKSIIEMQKEIKYYDFILGSRYKFGNKSIDDTAIRSLGNKFFTKIARIFLKLKFSDALFFFPLILNADYKKIKPKSNGFGLCIEIPFLLAKKGLKYNDLLSLERKRYGGKSKVNALFDGTKILLEIIRIYMFEKVL